MKPELRKKLSDNADDIADLCMTAKHYAKGGAWTMAAAIFHAIDKKARQAKEMAEWKSEETVRANPRRKRYGSVKKLRKYKSRRRISRRYK